MKIISGFRDYYDSAQAYGQDPARVYRRETRLVEVRGDQWPYRTEPIDRAQETAPRFWASYRKHEMGWLLFCGRAWPVYGPGDMADVVLTVGSADGLVLLPSEWERRYESEAPLSREGRIAADAFFGRRDRDPAYDHATTRAEMAANDANLAGSTLGEDVLVGLCAPCALLLPAFGARPNAPLQRALLIANPRLADLGFQRILDPYACFQAIETFLGNQLAPPDLAPQRVGGDEIVAAQKGFDARSFRTDAPGRKKENRAANRLRKRGA